MHNFLPRRSSTGVASALAAGRAGALEPSSAVDIAAGAGAWIYTFQRLPAAMPGAAPSEKTVFTPAMCLVIFAHKVHPDYPLIVAANRDEFHARATQASHFWPSHPELLAGRDGVQGGTWMGVTRSSRFAAITNYRNPARAEPAPRSRGALPLDFLIGQDTPGDYLAALGESANTYAGFNLLAGDGDDLWYFSNRDSNPPLSLQPGIYGLSNAFLDTPWPKSELGKRGLSALLHLDGSPAALAHNALAGIVADRRTADRARLLELGLDSEMAYRLSPQFIVGPDYGTRSCTTLWISRTGDIHWREQSFDPGGRLRGEAPFTFARRQPPQSGSEQPRV